MSGVLQEWLPLFNSVESHPTEFYEICAKLLEGEDLFEPGDVGDKDELMRKLATHNPPPEVLAFLKKVFSGGETGGYPSGGSTMDIVADVAEPLLFPYIVGPFLMDKANLAAAYNSFFDNVGATMGIPKPNLESDTSSMAGLDPGRAGLGGGDILFCQLSPLHKITLDEETKDLANIPREASSFAWAYPVVVDPSAPITFRDDPVGFFLRFGGYCYFNDRFSVVGTNGISPAANIDTLGLMFGRPHDLDEGVTSTITKQGRFQDITIEMMVSKGASHFAWIRPGEFNEKVAAPDGAFAYKFDLVNGKAKYYPVVAKPTYTTDMKNEVLEKEEAWVAVRNAGRRPKIETLNIFDKTKSFEENCTANALEIDTPFAEVQAYKEKNPSRKIPYEDWAKTVQTGTLTQPWILEVVRAM